MEMLHHKTKQCCSFSTNVFAVWISIMPEFATDMCLTYDYLLLIQSANDFYHQFMVTNHYANLYITLRSTVLWNHLPSHF
jgi:hypothetical protein